MANGSRHSQAFVKETVYGETPATPTWTPLRGGRSQLGLQKDATRSEELRSDRMIADSRHGTQQVGGAIPFELSFGSFDEILAGALQGTWTANRLDAGIDRASYTIERFFGDLQSADRPYHRFAGCEIASFDMTVAPNRIVTGTFNVLGQGASTDTVEVAASTYSQATTSSPFDTFDGELLEGGVANGVITEISLNLDNGLEPRFVAFSKETIRPQTGRSTLTGTLTAYFENSTLYDKFLNETESSIVFTLGDGVSSSYRFSMPRVKYNSGKPDVTDEGAILISMDFEALLDSGEGTSFFIERIV